MKLEFSRKISKNAKISNFVKIRPVGAELFDADRQADKTKLRVAFSNANAPITVLHRTGACDRNNTSL